MREAHRSHGHAGQPGYVPDPRGLPSALLTRHGLHILATCLAVGQRPGTAMKLTANRYPPVTSWQPVVRLG